jgi:hypothetical protein
MDNSVFEAVTMAFAVLLKTAEESSYRELDKQLTSIEQLVEIRYIGILPCSGDSLGYLF